MLSGCCEPLLPPAARILAAGVSRWGIASVWLCAAVLKARNQGALRSTIGKLMPARLSDAVAVVLAILDLHTAMPQGGCGCFGRAAALAENASIDATTPATARNLVLVALAVVVATQP